MQGQIFDKELEGPLLPVEDVERNILEFLAAVHGPAYAHEIEYQGINYNFTSNVDIKLYSWRVHIYLDGYRLNNISMSVPMPAPASSTGTAQKEGRYVNA